MSHPIFARALVPVLVLATQVTLSAQTQPTNVAALHRSGQTFVTWTEDTTLTGESYRIYRHNAPITATNLPANPLQEVTEDSGRFFADIHDGQKRFFDRFVITNQTELSAGTGLLVWTLNATDLLGGASGPYYYAVTTVHQGVENVTNFLTNVSNSVTESIDRPAPVLGKQDPSRRGHVFIQYMDLRNWNPTFDAPNPTNSFYGLTNPRGALQYAYTYSVQQPASGNGPFPLLIDLHHFDGQMAGSTAPLPVIPNLISPIRVQPVDPGNTWWFGFEAKTDYRTGTPSGAPGEVVRNFTEHRLLRMIFDLCRDPVIGPRIDPNRIYVTGFSMGASGTLSLATRYPSLFAAAFADKPVSNYVTLPDFLTLHNEALWGAITTALTVDLLPSPSTWGCHLPSRANGVSVWKWQDHGSELSARRRDEIVPIGVNHGIADNVLPWVTQGQPLYPNFNVSNRCYGGLSTPAGHLQQFVGMPPTMPQSAIWNLFSGFTVVRDETVPGMANCTSDISQPLSVRHNQDVEWHASWTSPDWDSAPVDQVGTWRVSLRAPAPVKVDITPRRTQAFHVEPGAVYAWSNFDIATGQVIASGTVTGDSDGLVTVPTVLVNVGGNQLTISRSNPYSLTVSTLTTPIPGTLSISNATPNTLQAVQISVGGIDVSTISTPFGSVLFRLCDPKTFALLVSDAGGRAAHTFAVTDSTQGAAFWFQSLELPSLATTNVVERVVK